MTVRKLPPRAAKPGRRLWYHPESESYVVSYSIREDQALANEGCLEVSGIEDHEAAYLVQANGNLRRALEAIERTYGKGAVGLRPKAKTVRVTFGPKQKRRRPRFAPYYRSDRSHWGSGNPEWEQEIDRDFQDDHHFGWGSDR